jgi:hypothetical protein
MSSRNKAVRIALINLGLIALLCVGGYSWFLHSFRAKITAAPFEPLETTLKKAASDIVVAKEGQNGPLASSSPAHGYIVAYEQNPQGFKADAKLFDTWLTSVQIADSVLEHGPKGNWVRSSSEIDSLKPETRIDPWGHALCLLRRSDAVLVISGGPEASSSPTCKDVEITTEELTQFPQKKLLQSPSGSLILVADKAPGALLRSSK